MHAKRELVLNGEALAEVRSLKIASEGSQERITLELSIEGLAPDAVAAKRQEVEVILRRDLATLTIQELGKTTFTLSPDGTLPTLEGIEWVEGKGDVLSKTLLATLEVSRLRSDAPSRRQWSRVIEREGEHTLLHLIGEAEGFGAMAFIESLRDAEGVASHEKIEEGSDGVARFRLTFPQATGAPLSSETISARETHLVVEHRPMALNAPMIRQRIGGPKVEATQRGEASSPISWPAAAAPKWPGRLRERVLKHEKKNGVFITHWEYRFALDALAEAIGA